MFPRHALLAVPLGLSTCVALAPRIAHADAPAADRNVAQLLFDQAKDLMAAGKFAEACPKLEESERLDPGGGTMLNLAVCHDGEGRTATAWSDFKEALGLARRDGRADRETLCLDRLAVLEPKIPRLTFLVPSPVAGEEVRLDGALMGTAVWGVPAPVDPGHHELAVSAPGKQPFDVQFDIAAAEKKTLTIPALVDAPEATPAGPVGVAAVDEQKHADAVRKRRTLAYIVGGSGIVIAAVGGVFGVRTLSKKSESDDACPSRSTCTQAGKDAMDAAHTSAWIADIGIGVGLVGIGVGTYLLVTAGSAEQPPGTPPKTARRPLYFDAGVLPGGARAMVGGAF